MSDDDGALPQVANRWLGIVGLIVAPTTLITSLLYYFGYVSTRKNMLYFGIDPNAVGYTTSDYVANSVGVVFAMTLGLLAVFAALLLAGLFIRPLGHGRAGNSDDASGSMGFDSAGRDGNTGGRCRRLGRAIRN